MRNPREPNNYEEYCGPLLISIKTSDLGSSGKKVPKIIVKLPKNSEGGLHGFVVGIQRQQCDSVALHRLLVDNSVSV